MPFGRCLALSLFVAQMAASQSVYTLEAIAADQFQPKAGFTEIGGRYIDAHGNVAGVARKLGRSLGFYWPTADSVKALTFADSAGEFNCDPVGMTGKGDLILGCAGGRSAVLRIPLASSGSAASSSFAEAGQSEYAEALQSLRFNSGVSVSRTSSPDFANQCGNAPHNGSLQFSSFWGRDKDREPEMLPLVAGDATVTIMMPMGAAPDGHAVVGTRDGVECVSGSSVNGRHAVVWTRSDSKWTASVLDQIPISLEVGLCAHSLVLEEANDISDAGQITGKGTCVDIDGDRRAIVYRLTPVGIRLP